MDYVDYTMTLALYDFVPVALTASGMWWTYRMVTFLSPALGRWALLGGALVVSGGAAKALWKLIMAITAGSVDLRWLDASLFVLMSPGFLLVLASVWGATRTVRDRRRRLRVSSASPRCGS